MNQAVVTALTVSCAFVLAVAATGLVRSWLSRRQVVDTPNERSLHRRATVTGGGVAVALVVITVWSGLWMIGKAPNPVLLVPIAGLSLIGLMDDVHNLGWIPKLGLQLVLAVVFVSVYGSFSQLEAFGLALDAPALNAVFSILWILALVNIYNFMDGIDGLAGGYGALKACVLGLWFAVLGGDGLSLYLYGVMAACLGFLIWNWSPARIFLGDSGSMMLGGTLASIAILGQREYDIPLGAFILLYAVFIGDTMYTLARRARRGEKLWRAHREHLYQRAVQSGLGHAAVTGIVLGLSAIISVFASLEMSRTGPRILWLLLCLAILWTAMMLVKKREQAAL